MLNVQRIQRQAHGLMTASSRRESPAQNALHVCNVTVKLAIVVFEADRLLRKGPGEEVFNVVPVELLDTSTLEPVAEELLEAWYVFAALVEQIITLVVCSEASLGRSALKMESLR